MHHLLFMLTLLMIVFPYPVNAEWKASINLQTDASSNTNIETPVAGQAIQGSVVIRGSTNPDGFQKYEVNFSYSGDPTHTWFLIQESNLPVQNGVLAVWDTTTITDGEYSLRLLVSLTDGNEVEVLIDGLRVRNYSSMETGTPAPIPAHITLVPGRPEIYVPGGTPTSTLTPEPPAPTSLPTNPAEISTSQMILNLGQGVAYSIGIFAILGAYLGLRALLRNHK